MYECERETEKEKDFISVLFAFVTCGNHLFCPRENCHHNGGMPSSAPFFAPLSDNLTDLLPLAHRCIRVSQDHRLGGRGISRSNDIYVYKTNIIWGIKFKYLRKVMN